MTAASLDIDTLFLEKGTHSCTDGACLMEARALLLGKPKTDSRPFGTSSVLHNFGIALNDAFPDDRRQELKRFLPRDGVDPLADTDDDEQDEVRSYMALDWLIRTYTPAFLDLLPELTDVAAELRGLRPIVDLASAQSAGPVVRKAQEKSVAAWDAAWDAAEDAAEDAAWVAAWVAARVAAWDAARDAAWDAARVAAWNAALAAARSAARDAALAAARSAAWDAARVAAWNAALAAARVAAWNAALAAARSAARDAAWDAARVAAVPALQPTVNQLQTSAIELYAAMVSVRTAEVTV